MYKYIGILLLGGLGTGLSGQSGLLADLQVKWTNAAEYTLEVAERMPEEYYGFKPTEEEMSFEQQLLHMAGNINWLTSSYLGGAAVEKDLTTTGYGKAEIIAMLKDVFERSAQATAHLTEAQLEDPVTFFAGPMNKRRILLLLHDHLSHHRGQLVVYLRLKGIVPPKYRGW